MTKTQFRPARAILIALGSCLIASGCATPAYVSPVQVTRFVSEGPAALGQGTIELRAAPGLMQDLAENSLRYSLYSEAIRRELEALGYQVVSQNGDQIAQIGIEQNVLVPGEQRGPVSVGVGGGTGSYGSGVGLGVGFDLSGPDPDRIDTSLAVTIRAATGGQNLWEGRAGMSATTNSDYAGDAEAAQRIADALFQDFPGMSGETIIVE